MAEQPPSPTLAELQQAMMDAIEKATATPALCAAIKPRGPLSPEDLLTIYRGQTRCTLVDALAKTYPVLHRHLGDAKFRRLGLAYIAAHPSRSGDLDRYGAAFAAFLRNQLPADEPAGWIDMASFEWQLSRVIQAPACPPFDRAALASLDTDALPQLHLSLVPRSRLFRSKYPVLDWWQAAQSPSQPAVSAPPTDTDPCALVIHYDGVDIQFSRLEFRDYGWVEALAEGASLQAATARSLEQHPDFDLARALARVLHLGMFTAPT